MIWHWPSVFRQSNWSLSTNPLVSPGTVSWSRSPQPGRVSRPLVNWRGMKIFIATLLSFLVSVKLLLALRLVLLWSPPSLAVWVCILLGLDIKWTSIPNRFLIGTRRLQERPMKAMKTLVFSLLRWFSIITSSTAIKPLSWVPLSAMWVLKL